MPHHLTLFGTSACHLCEQAEELILASLVSGTYSLEKVEITEDPVLLDKYGVYIPVLEREGGEAPLYWPFDKQKLFDFLALPPPVKNQ